MEWLTWMIILIVIALVIVFAILDGDILLMYAERYGLKPDVLQEKVVWITGASSGLGEYLAYELAAVGCKLVLSARNENELERVKKACIANGKVTESSVMVLPLDVTDYSMHAGAVGKVLQVFERIDVLVNNAGRSQRALFADVDLEVDKALFEVNVFGPIALTREVLPHMIANKSGHIVVTSSITGKFGTPICSSYCATKHAMQGYCNSLRAEVHADNIKVTVVNPGPVKSNILRAAATANVGEVLGPDACASLDMVRMPTERCAHLMAVAIANQSSEVWISTHPVLFYAYLAQYCPWLFDSLLIMGSKKRIQGFKDWKAKRE
ncbi:dehydrogenase/reductase SDR family member 7 [Lingula anatina]|uniref:Dehydrogenase/reductase SDR family member 7 n=1 Tax=Lingula anatina TaxID=7574 RepID=A0A1S3HGV8_LINAN|nr:dehydrogenase/reductase SDR family member 7 [Lingula anatina]|eukprot:XP_013385313.1 dehydrogenase/reductase SDR family member 7 [Lingula anatina]